MCSPKSIPLLNADVDVEVRYARIASSSPNRELLPPPASSTPSPLNIWRVLLYAYYTEIEFPACQTILTSFLSFDENYISINLYYPKFSVNALLLLLLCICLQKPLFSYHPLIIVHVHKPRQFTAVPCFCCQNNRLVNITLVGFFLKIRDFFRIDERIERLLSKNE